MLKPMDPIFCHYLKQYQPSLTKGVYPGVLGLYIQSHISNPAWELWKTHQIKLINEYKLTPILRKDRDFLKKEMILFLGITEPFE